MSIDLWTLGSKAGKRIRKILYSPKKEVKLRLKDSRFALRRLGTRYGGWTFCETPGLEGSTIVSCGAGEDISFDVEMVKHYGVHAVIVDPTPRALAHFTALKSGAGEGKRVAIDRSTVDFYDLSGVDFDRMSWIDKAIWSLPTRLKFYKPKDESHVSHSLTNLQDTKDFIEVDTVTLSQIKDSLGARKISLLKMDIEGAEIEVLSNLPTGGFFPDQVLVEFEELNFSRKESRARVLRVLDILESRGYDLVFFDGRSNCTFLRR